MYFSEEDFTYDDYVQENFIFSTLWLNEDLRLNVDLCKTSQFLIKGGIFEIGDYSVMHYYINNYTFFKFISHVG